MTETQQRVAHVLEKIKAQVLADDDYASMYSFSLEAFLSEANGDDAFGTEGQEDPRGDFREGVWSMDHVQGIDA